MINPNTTSSNSGAKLATELGTLEKLLGRKSGASIAEMTKATGWEQHTVRGALAGAIKKRGHMFSSEKVDGTRRYLIVGASGE